MGVGGWGEGGGWGWARLSLTASTLQKLEINPPKTACGCPCGVAMKNKIKYTKINPGHCDTQSSYTVRDAFVTECTITHTG